MNKTDDEIVSTLLRITERHPSSLIAVLREIKTLKVQDLFIQRAISNNANKTIAYLIRKGLLTEEQIINKLKDPNIDFRRIGLAVVESKQEFSPATLDLVIDKLVGPINRNFGLDKFITAIVEKHKNLSSESITKIFEANKRTTFSNVYMYLAKLPNFSDDLIIEYIKSPELIVFAYQLDHRLSAIQIDTLIANKHARNGYTNIERLAVNNELTEKQMNDILNNIEKSLPTNVYNAAVIIERLNSKQQLRLFKMYENSLDNIFVDLANQLKYVNNITLNNLLFVYQVLKHKTLKIEGNPMNLGQSNNFTQESINHVSRELVTRMTKTEEFKGYLIKNNVNFLKINDNQIIIEKMLDRYYKENKEQTDGIIGC